MFNRSFIGLLLLSIVLLSGCIITGKVTDGNGNGIEGVTVTLTGAANLTTTTNSNGGYIFGNFFDWILVFTSYNPILIIPGSYTVTPTKAGYSFTPSSSGVSVTAKCYGPLAADFPWPVGGINFEVFSDPILAKTELLKGYWHFYYTIISTWHDYYTLYYISGDRNDQGGYYIYGTDEWGYLVVAAYWPDDGIWSLLSEGIIIDQFYDFYTNGTNVLPNSCYYQIDVATGDWSQCFTLYGSKIGYLSALSQEKTTDIDPIVIEEQKRQEVRETETLRHTRAESAFIDERAKEKYRCLKEILDSLE